MLRTNQLAGTDQVCARAHRQRRHRHRSDAQPGARRRRHPAPARPRARRSRPGATTAPPGRGSASSRLDLRRRRLRRRRPARARPAASTTSARAAWSRHPPARPPPSPRSPATRASTLSLDCADLRRRLRAHRLHASYRGTSSGRESFLDERGHVDELRRHSGLTNGTDLLLQGVRGERARRGPALERGLRDPRRPRPADAPLAVARRLQPPQREPALRRRALDERRQRRRESGLHVTSNQLACSTTTTCTAWRNDRPVRPRRRGLGAALDAARRRTTSIRLYARLQQPGTGLRRLHAAHEPARRDRPGLRSSGSTTAPLVTRSRSTRSSPPATSCSCAPRARARGLAQRRARWSRLGVVARLDLPRRRLRRASACAGRPAGSTTSGRGRWALAAARHEPPSAPGEPERDRRRARPRSTSPGQRGHRRRRHRRSYRIERCSGAGCSDFAEIAHERHDELLEHRPRRLDLLLLPRARPGRRRSTSAPTRTPRRRRPPAPPDTDASERAGNARAATAGQLDPDRPLLGRGHRRRRSDPVPASSAARARAARTSPRSRTAHRDELLEHRPRRRRPPTPTACAPRTPRSTSAPTRTRRRRSTPAPPDTSLPARREPEPRPPPARPRSTSPGPRPPTTRESTLYRIERCSGAGCSIFGEIATERRRRATRTPASPPRPPTPTACAPRTPRSTSAPTRPRRRPRRRAASSPRSSRCRRRQLQPAQREPPGQRLVERDRRLRRDGPAREFEHDRVHEDDDVHGLADNPAFGPDTEVWARVTTLPGNGNQFRLYARLQKPAWPRTAATCSGRTSSPGPTRCCSSGSTTGAIGHQAHDLAGARRRRHAPSSRQGRRRSRRGSSGASTWTLLGSVADSTYGAAGCVGVGIRGKTGRLDDFGAR